MNANRFFSIFLSKFQKPKHWVIFGSWASIFFRHLIVFGILSLLFWLLGISLLFSLSDLFAENIYTGLGGLFFALFFLYVAFRWNYKIYYHLIYFRRIQKNGIEVKGIMEGVKTVYFQIHLTQFSHYRFYIVFQDDQQQTYRVPARILKTHWYSKQVQEGKTVALQYLEADPRKIRILK